MRRFSLEEIVETWERLGDGQSDRSTAIGLGRYPSRVLQLAKRTGSAPPLVVKSRGPHFLSAFERKEICRRLLMLWSIPAVAQELRRTPSTISR